MWLLYLLIALCMGAGWLAGLCHISACLLMSVYIALGAWLDTHHRTIASKLAILLGVLFLVTVVGIDIMRHIGWSAMPIHVFLNLIWSMLAYRAICHESTKDRVQIGILALIPMAAVAVVLPALAFIVFLIGYLVILFSYLASQSLAVPTTGSVACSINQGHHTANRQIMGRCWISKKFWLASMGMAVLAFIIGSFLFLVMPRFHSGNGMSPTALEQQASAAFPDVDLGKTGTIQVDPSLVFRADIPESPQPQYWRIDIQEHFDGSKWVNTSNDHPRAASSKAPENVYRVEFMRPWRDNRIPSLAHTRDIWPSKTEQWQHKPQFYHDKYHVWHKRSWPPFVNGYDFVFETGPENDKEPSKNWSQSIWPLRPGDDSSHQRLFDLAYQIAGQSPSGEQKAGLIRDYLQSHYRYSLERPKRDAAIVEDFLFNQKYGHCEIFSTAMAVLLAIENVPVRNVTGFASSEYRDGYHLVRSAHAHSWVEVYIDGKGWTVYDPTPPGAQHVEINWIVRINDWFASYKTADFYAFVGKYWINIVSVLAALAALWLILRRMMRRIRKCLDSTNAVRVWAWQEFLASCKKNPGAQSYIQRSYEKWYDSCDDSAIGAFVRENIECRFGPYQEPKSSWNRLLANHRTLSLLAKARCAVRGLR